MNRRNFVTSGTATVASVLVPINSSAKTISDRERLQNLIDKGLPIVNETFVITDGLPLNPNRESFTMRFCTIKSNPGGCYVLESSGKICIENCTFLPLNNKTSSENFLFRID